MEANEFQKIAHTFVTDGANCAEYALHGLVEEVGEVVGKFAKYKRKNIFTPWPMMEFRDGVRLGIFSQGRLRDEDRKFLAGVDKELGDVCWMLAELCTQYGLKLDRVMQRNIKKLADRKARGVIVGEGDAR